MYGLKALSFLVFWCLAATVWLAAHGRVTGWIEARVVRPLFTTDPVKTTTVLYRLVIAFFIYKAFNNLKVVILANKLGAIAETIGGG